MQRNWLILIRANVDDASPSPLPSTGRGLPSMSSGGVKTLKPASMAACIEA